MLSPYMAPPQYSPPRSGVPVWAWVVIGCACLPVILMAIFGAILFPVFAQAREEARTESCMANLRQLTENTRIYAEDHDGALPKASKWMDAIEPYVHQDGFFHCPSVPAVSGHGYAFNSRISQKEVNKISTPEQTPMIYDSIDLSRNANDPVTNLPNPPRHRRGGKKGNCIGEVDGHAKFIPPGE